MLHLAPTFAAPGPGITVFQVAAWLIVAVIIFCIFTAVAHAARAEVGLRGMPRNILVTIAVVSLVFGLAGAAGAMGIETSNAQDAHAQAVASWLDDNYGIELNADGVSSLLHGHNRVVQYEGADTLITLVPSGSNGIAVVSADNNTVLVAKGGDK